mgnify:CR=1 FL=1
MALTITSACILVAALVGLYGIRRMAQTSTTGAQGLGIAVVLCLAAAAIGLIGTVGFWIAGM